jgi:FkbM family methyltransferase
MVIVAPDDNSLVRFRRALGEHTKTIAGNLLMKCVGRRNLARAARFLTNTARLDIKNDMHTNGELLVQKVILKHFPTDRDLVVFDVGANIGEWSAQLLKATEYRSGSHSLLCAFEPVSSTMRMLQANLQGLSSGWNVMPVQRALSDRQCVSRISVVEESCGINAIVPDPKVAIKRTEEIELTTIDDYCQANDISELALLKIDAEGHDFFVLRGARRSLEQKKIHVVQFEYNSRWVWSRATLFDVFEYVKNLDYRVGKVTPKGIEFYDSWDEELEKFVEGNYLLCRLDWIERFPRVSWWKTS